MSLAALLYPGPTDQGLEEFFFANYQHHLALIDAVQMSKGVLMPLFQIYPVVYSDNISSWEEQHQKQHNLLAQHLGVDSQDLTGIDFNDKSGFDAWVQTHFLQHQAAGQLCGFSI